jgi:hypothetical protein
MRTGISVNYWELPEPPDSKEQLQEV